MADKRVKNNSLSADEKQKIARKFLIDISHYAIWNINGHIFRKEKFINHCFYRIFKNMSIVDDISHNLSSGCYKGANSTYIELIHFMDDEDDYNKESPEFRSNLDSFAKLLLTNDNVTDNDFRKMQSVDEDLYDWLGNYTDNFNNKHYHHIGLSIILTTFILTLLIPSYPINIASFATGNGFLFVCHFLALRFEDLRNVASIGRLVINLIVDIPTIKYFYFNKTNR